MSKTFVISGVSYLFPEQGSSPPYGEQITDWAEATTNALAAFSSAGDIPTIGFSLSNNINSPANITGFSFDNGTIQGFIAEYSIYRVVKDSSSVIQEEYTECGTIHGSFKIGAGTWSATIVGNNVTETGITIVMDNSGQLMYTSSNLTIPIGGSHTCRMVFRARAFSQ